MSTATRILLFTLLVAGTAAAEEPPATGGTGWAEVPLKTLREASSARDIDVEGARPTSYRRVFVNLKNRRGARVAVDLCGSYLRPKPKGSCQRLGLGTPVDPRKTRRRGSGTVVVHLEPGETFELEMNTCCLDAGMPAPSAQEFVAAERKLPPVREQVLRWWADNPNAPQGAVNRAIWQFSPTVDLSGRKHATGPPAHGAAAYAGTVYRLRGGALTTLDREGIERFLGTDIRDVFPAADTTYAVAPDDHGRPSLWRFALTGPEPWGFVARAEWEGETIRDVFPCGVQRLVVVTSRAAYVRRGQAAWVELISVPPGGNRGDTSRPQLLSVHAVSEERLLVAIRRPGKAPRHQGGEPRHEQAPHLELWAVDLRTGQAEREKALWNVRDLAIGPAGVFGLSHGGRLRRLRGTSLRDLGPRSDYGRLLHVGRRTVWLVAQDGHLAAVDARSGRERRRAQVGPTLLDSLRLDSVTDDLVGVADGAWARFPAAGGVREVVPAPR